MPFVAHFEIDIITALSEQLLKAFDELIIGQLTLDNLAQIPPEQGVYQLYHHDILVYVGQAQNLRSRVDDHRSKIEGRQNISAAEIGFKCLTVHPNWTALSPEASLISHYKQNSPNLCAWNGNGFGPHDPGRERETTNKPTNGFDQQYPIRQDWPLVGIIAGRWNANDLLQKMKSDLPFLLRYQVGDTRKLREGHPDYANLLIEVAQSGMPAVGLLRLIAQSLPPGWQATRFPSHMILYKEQRAYPHGIVVWPS